MFIECTANGWNFARDLGEVCQMKQTFTFNVEVPQNPVPTCDNIKDTMNTILGKPLQDFRCSSDVVDKQGDSDWKTANFEVTHTNYDITQDDIKSVLQEDSTSFRLELERRLKLGQTTTEQPTTEIRVGSVNDLQQYVQFEEITVIDVGTSSPTHLPTTFQRSTSALPGVAETSTTTSVDVIVESSSGDDYTLHLIIGCVALVCICVGQYFWCRLSKSVQKIQEVYTGETKEDEEVGSPKMVGLKMMDLASDEGELQMKDVVSDEAVAIDPSKFLGELYDYYLSTNKDTAGKEGEGTTTTENNDWKFLLFE